MMTLDPFLRQFGEEVEIRRGGEVVLTVKAIINKKDKTTVAFKPETNLLTGDIVVSLVSGTEYAIESVEKVVAFGKLYSVEGHYTPHRPRHAPPVFQNTGIIAGSISHSAIQQHSPNAVQNMAIGADQVGKAKDAIRIILEAIQELDLSDEDRDEVKEDAEFAAKKLEGPKPKWDSVKELLKGLGTKVTAGLTAKVSEEIVSRVSEAVTSLRQCFE